jgi:hypothetical protein
MPLFDMFVSGKGVLNPLRQLAFIINMAEESEFISEKDINSGSIEVISKETSEYSGHDCRSGWRALDIRRSYRKRFLCPSHTPWRDRIHRNGSIPIECGKHGNKFLFKEAGKKRSIADKRQGIYEHLNKNIFRPLLEYRLESLHDYPFSRLKLKYDLSAVKDNPDYEEAKTHWENDLPKSVTDPEQLEEKVKSLDDDVDGFFSQKAVEYVMEIQWDDLSLSDEQTGIPPLNHVSLPNIMKQIRLDWIEGQNTKRFERYDRESGEYTLNGLAIAHVEPHLENHLSKLLDVVRGHYTINQIIQSFKERRQQLLKEHAIVEVRKHRT